LTPAAEEEDEEKGEKLSTASDENATGAMMKDENTIRDRVDGFDAIRAIAFGVLDCAGRGRGCVERFGFFEGGTV
jgi:hypothetical protein